MASGKIKGITVEIGGDTTKLGNALEGVNKKTKDLQSELKGVNTLLKMDPSNVTLLQQKQDLLTGAIAGTKEKLDTLKTAQEQVQAQFDKGEITEEQYRDFQREIVVTEQKLESLTDQLKEFGSVGAQQVAQVGEKMQDVGGKVENAGKKFSIISAGTGAVLAGSIAAFTELDSGYDTIITKTGATGDALEGLNTVADNIFGSMPTDMDTVGIAVGEVNTRFGLTGDALEDLSTRFIQFSEINGVDLNNSIGTVDKILEQFNLDASDTGSVLDIVTAKAQQTGIGADTLMNSIQQNGATFKDMGIGVNEAVVLMAQFEANGVNVETALKGLKKATTEYADEGLSMDEALGATIDSIKNAKTETEALSIAQEVFGVKGAGEMAKAIREGRINVEDLGAAMGDYSGTVTDTFSATLDPVDDATVAMNNLKLAGSELGGVLQSTFAPMLTALVEKVKNLVSWFGNLSPGMQKTIVIILSVVTALGPLIIIIGKLISSVGTIMTFAPKLATAFSAVKTAFTSLGSAFAANPIGIVIVAITALVAAFIYLWNNCDAFRQFWINLWNGIKAAFAVVVEWIKATAPKIADFFISAWNKIKEVWSGVKAFFGNVWSGIKNVFSAVGSWFKEKFIAAWNGIKSAWSGVKSFFGNIWSGVKGVFSSVGSWFGNVFSNAWSAIKNVFSNWGSFFSGLWGKIKSTFSKLGSNIANAIGNAVKSGINGVISMIENTINRAIGLINGAISLINLLPGVSVGKVKTVSLPRLAHGGIVDSPTIAEIGEDGREAVIPLEKNTGWIREIAKQLNDYQSINGGNNGALLAKLDGIYERLGRLQVVLDTGTLVGETLDKIDTGLANRQLLSARGG